MKEGTTQKRRLIDESASWLWKAVGRAKVNIAFLTILQAVQGGIGVFYALFLKNIVNSAIERDRETFVRNVVYIILQLLVATALSAVIRALNEHTKTDIENRLKSRFLDNILHKDYSSVSLVHTGEWMNRITSDTSVIAGSSTDIVPGLAGTLIRLISAAVMVAILDYRFAAILIPVGLIVSLLTVAFRKKLKKLHKDIQESDGRLRVFLQERIGNLMLIKSFAGETRVHTEAKEKMKDHKDARIRRNIFSNLCSTGFGAAKNGMYLAGILYCAYGIFTGSISYGTLTAFMQLVGQVMAPFSNISGFLPKWYSMTASAERLMEIESYSDDGKADDLEKIRDYYDKSFEKITLKDVDFKYPKTDDNEPPMVLDKLNLEICKGEIVGFVGRSGCGKSTVLKLLMCMYHPKSGEIKIDDEGLTARYRRLFAYVPQGNALMNGTIREAVAFSDPEGINDEERIGHALKVACADGFVGNIDAMLGERGSGLSEGQTQRLAIARAVFSRSPVLLLDEATSALDEATEKQLLVNLRSMTDKTVMIVTHRKAALSICDRVIRFDN